MLALAEPSMFADVNHNTQTIVPHPAITHAIKQVSISIICTFHPQ